MSLPKNSNVHCCQWYLSIDAFHSLMLLTFIYWRISPLVCCVSNRPLLRLLHWSSNRPFLCLLYAVGCKEVGGAGRQQADQILPSTQRVSGVYPSHNQQWSARNPPRGPHRFVVKTLHSEDIPYHQQKAADRIVLCEENIAAASTGNALTYSSPKNGRGLSGTDFSLPGDFEVGRNCTLRQKHQDTTWWSVVLIYSKLCLRT